MVWDRIGSWELVCGTLPKLAGLGAVVEAVVVVVVVVVVAAVEEKAENGEDANAFEGSAMVKRFTGLSLGALVAASAAAAEALGQSEVAGGRTNTGVAG